MSAWDGSAYVTHPSDLPAPACEHCDGRDHISEDCVMRPAPCEWCGKMWTRDDLFWHGDYLIGDCCDGIGP